MSLRHGVVPRPDQRRGLAQSRAADPLRRLFFALSAARIEALRRIEPLAPAPELEVVSAVRSNVRRVSGWRGGRARSR